VLQCVAVCCSVLQYVAVSLVVSFDEFVSYPAVCCSVLQCVEVCCSVFQYIAVHCSVLQRDSRCLLLCLCRTFWCVWRVAVYYNVDVCCSVLQYVAVCCSESSGVCCHVNVVPLSVLQCVAVYCSV